LCVLRGLALDNDLFEFLPDVVQALFGSREIVLAGRHLLFDLRETDLQLAQRVGDMPTGWRSIKGRYLILPFPQPCLESGLALKQAFLAASLGLGGSLGNPFFLTTAVLFALASGCFLR
jgi:hypothetical protein